MKKVAKTLQIKLQNNYETRKPNKRLCVDVFNNIIASFTRIKQILCIAGPVGGRDKKNLAPVRKNIVSIDSEGARVRALPYRFLPYT